MLACSSTDAAEGSLGTWNKLLLSCSRSARAVCPALPMFPRAGHSTSSCLIKTVIPMLLCLAERWERQQVAQGTETPLP